MFLRANNGRANIWGSIGGVLKTKADETVSAVAATVAEQAAENVRIAKGESKFKFYGSILWAWFKKHWYWILLPVGLVLVWKIGKRLFSRKRSKKRY